MIYNSNSYTSTGIYVSQCFYQNRGESYIVYEDKFIWCSFEYIPGLYFNCKIGIGSFLNQFLNGVSVYIMNIKLNYYGGDLTGNQAFSGAFGT